MRFIYIREWKLIIIYKINVKPSHGFARKEDAILERSDRSSLYFSPDFAPPENRIRSYSATRRVSYFHPTRSNETGAENIVA